MWRAVILADVVGSKAIERSRALRDARLGETSRAHRNRGWLEHDYAVTTGDEFQNLLAAPRHVPWLVFDLRRRFRPHELRVGIGLGSVRSRPAPGEPVNVGGTGRAFELAREAMESLRSDRDASRGAGRDRLARKYRYLTAFRSEDDDLDRPINVIYRLVDTLLQRVTDRQWETISAYEETSGEGPRSEAGSPPAGRQDRAAARLGIDESTFSRNLRRADYWQTMDAVRAVAEMLEDR